MLDSNVISREYSSTDLVKLTMDTVLAHDERLIEALEHD